MKIKHEQSGLWYGPETEEIENFLGVWGVKDKGSDSVMGVLIVIAFVFFIVYGIFTHAHTA